MDIKYIVAIVAGSLFLLLLLIFIILNAQRRQKLKLQRQRLEQMYADKNLVKMEYDFLVYDEEMEKIFAEQMERAGQTAFSDDSPSAPTTSDKIFQTVDTDGLEEIVGHYKPE